MCRSQKRQGDDGQEDSRPSSVVSNESYRSTHDDLDPPTQHEDNALSSVKEEEGKGGGDEEEIGLLREALRGLEAKLRDAQQENLLLRDRLTPAPTEEELQAQTLEAEGRYQEAQREVQKLWEELKRVEDAAAQKEALEQEVQKLREQQERDRERIQTLEVEGGGEVEDLKTSHTALLETLAQEKAQLASHYQEAQEEVKILQEALRGTVPVEAAASDFEEMKAELGTVIDGLQKRLMEMSHSYSDAKGELSSALSLLHAQAPPPDLPALKRQAEEAQAQRAAALQQIALLRRESEAQAKNSVPLADHTQVVTSLGSALKEAESQVGAIQERLAEKALQVEALQNRLTVEKDATPDDSVSRLEHQQMREALEAEVYQLTLLLQDALRKQDEMALETAAACQEARDGRSDREALREQLEAGERERDQLQSKSRAAQDTISDLRARADALLSSEQDKKKKVSYAERLGELARPCTSRA